MSAELTLLADDKVRFYAFASEDEWAQEAASAIGCGLSFPPREGKGLRGLLLSGGNTPAPVYSALSTLPLKWKQIGISLVDDRFLPEGDPNRNDGLIRRTLLTNAAAKTTFTSLIAPGDTLESAVNRANQNATPPMVVVLGMGDDGHTASLFPGMRGLDTALAADTPYVGVDATGCPGSQTWPHRISLTPAGLAPASMRILLIRGEGKRALLERVISSGTDVQEYPVRMAWRLPGPALDVYWCP